jgi:hypothetical protein
VTLSGADVDGTGLGAATWVNFDGKAGGLDFATGCEGGGFLLWPAANISATITNAIAPPTYRKDLEARFFVAFAGCGCFAFWSPFSSATANSVQFGKR